MSESPIHDNLAAERFADDLAAIQSVADLGWHDRIPYDPRYDNPMHPGSGEVA